MGSCFILVMNFLLHFREIDSKMERSSYLRREKWKVSVKLKRYRLALGSQKGADTVASNGGGVGMLMFPKFGMNKRLPRGRPPKRPFQGMYVYFECVLHEMV